MRLKHGIEGVNNLLSKSFLHRKTLGEQPHESRELGNADNVFVRDIPYIGLPMSRQVMMLTERTNRNLPLIHFTQAAVRLTATFQAEHLQQHWVAIIPFAPLTS